jgi:transcriptional regulator with XRE-family HTH domain
MRVAKGLTQGELASHLETCIGRHQPKQPVVNAEFIGDLERGAVGKVTPELVVWVADALRASIQQTAMLLDAAGFDGKGYVLRELTRCRSSVQELGERPQAYEAPLGARQAADMLASLEDAYLTEMQAFIPEACKRLDAARDPDQLARILRGAPRVNDDANTDNDINDMPDDERNEETDPSAN